MPIDYTSLLSNMDVSYKDENDSILRSLNSSEEIKERTLHQIPDYSLFENSRLNQAAKSIRYECYCILDMLSGEPENKELYNLLNNSFLMLDAASKEKLKRYQNLLQNHLGFASAAEGETEVINIIKQALSEHRSLSDEESARILKIRSIIDNDFIKEGNRVYNSISDVLEAFSQTEELGFSKNRFFDNEGLTAITSIKKAADIPSVLVKIPLSGDCCYRYITTKNGNDLYTLSESSLPDRYEDIKIVEIDTDKYIETINAIKSGDKSILQNLFSSKDLTELNRVVREYFDTQNRLRKTRTIEGAQPDTEYGIYGIVKPTGEYKGGAVEFCLALSNGTLKELRIIKGDIALS